MKKALLFLPTLCVCFLENTFENSMSSLLNWPKEMVMAQRNTNATLQLKVAGAGVPAFYTVPT